MRTTVVSGASQIIKKYSKYIGYHENITRRKQNRKQFREVTKTNMLEAGTFFFVSNIETVLLVVLSLHIAASALKKHTKLPQNWGVRRWLTNLSGAMYKRSLMQSFRVIVSIMLEI